MEIKKTNVKKATYLYVALVLAVVALAASICFYFSLSSPPVNDPGISLKQAADLDARGRQMSSAKKYDEAIGLYSQALTFRPGDYNILMDRAQAYYNKKDYQAAINDYQFALSSSSKIEGKADPAACANNALFGVALCQAALERPQMAVKTLHELQAKDGHYVKSYQVLGDIYLKSGDSESAIDAYTQGLRLNPDSSALHYDRSLAYLRREMRQQAFDDLSRAIDIDKNSLFMYLQHANLAYKMHKDELADADAREILRLEPDNKSAILWLKKRNREYDIPPESLKASANIKAGEKFPGGGSDDVAGPGSDASAQSGGDKKAGRKGHRGAKGGQSAASERALSAKSNDQRGEAFTANAPAESKEKPGGKDSAPAVKPEAEQDMKAQAKSLNTDAQRPQGDPGLPSHNLEKASEQRSAESNITAPLSSEQKATEKKGSGQ